MAQLQRGALLRICKGYRSISNDALPVITNILPIIFQSFKSSTRKTIYIAKILILIYSKF
ncbi:hypothetical protein BLOT_009103 [Blomia tropicalis]|nr:hypothetical protein BLOT_009103 [Blomia tropicalis]